MYIPIKKIIIVELCICGQIKTIRHQEVCLSNVRFLLTIFEVGHGFGT